MSEIATALSHPRTKRYERGEASPLTLTSRDFEVLRALRRVRFADSQIAYPSAVPGSTC